MTVTMKSPASPSKTGAPGMRLPRCATQHRAPGVFLCRRRLDPRSARHSSCRRRERPLAAAPAVLHRRRDPLVGGRWGREVCRVRSQPDADRAGARDGACRRAGGAVRSRGRVRPARRPPGRPVWTSSYTGGGSLVWLPDLDGWAVVVVRALRPGGRLILLEEHPLAACLEIGAEGELALIDDYFRRGKAWKARAGFTLKAARTRRKTNMSSTGRWATW